MIMNVDTYIDGKGRNLIQCFANQSACMFAGMEKSALCNACYGAFTTGTGTIDCCMNVNNYCMANQTNDIYACKYAASLCGCHLCSPFATCTTSSVASVKCSCVGGYVGDGITCTPCPFSQGSSDSPCFASECANQVGRQAA